ncbi:MAG: DEAD/DEAH box helicase [Polyangiaceae bacterium]|jgi:DEAD/DEAH box helicase domain-containing protein
MRQLPWAAQRGIEGVVQRWLASAWVKPCFCADEILAPSSGRYVELPAALAPSVARALRSRGIERLYEHQGRSIDAALNGRHIAVATPTASGKSLCFNVPVLHALAQDPNARALYLYPTKALARDQEAGMHDLMAASGIEVRAVVYDGDTPADARRAARDSARVVLTNPDMLHSGILPHHPSWARLFQHLRFVVIDELHTYKGVFGSHVANVLRRLFRIARFHGSSPRMLGATATIGNPLAHAARLYGVPRMDDVELVDVSGAPRGERRFFLFNPPVVNADLGIRASYVKQAVMLAADLVRAEVPTIVFGHSRNSVEIMLRYLREAVATRPSRTETRPWIDPARIVGYRGGYLPGQRRDIERRLRDGEILAVVATNALELGIDIGELDAVVCAGYPGSVAATWQRFGRAGRRGGQSVCVLVASSAPVDQFLARQPEFLLGAPVEEARIDPENVEILIQHLKCAAFELPFRRGDSFGSLGPEETTDALCFLGRHRVLHESGSIFHWAADSYPANEVSLRSVGWDNVVIIDVEHDRSIAELDWRASHTMLHEQAVYQHDGECWQVERFDYENHKAFVRRVDPDYWTEAMTYVQISILEESSKGPLFRHAWAGGWGEVALVEKVVGYKKIKFQTHENAGYGDVRLPEMQMHTMAFWFTVPESVCGTVPGGRSAAVDGLRGVGQSLETVATLALMCDGRDFGTTLGDAEATVGPSASTDRDGSPAAFNPTLFLYEHVPGGTGLAQRVWEEREALIQRTLDMIESCRCANGCPACVGPGEALRKRAAIYLLGALVNGQPTPQPAVDVPRTLKSGVDPLPCPSSPD